MQLIGTVCADDSGIIALSKNCTALESLSLNVVQGVSQNACWFSLFSAQHGLLVVDLYALEISDNLLWALAEHNSQLRCISLFECTGFTQTGVLKLMDGCHQMRTVHVKEDDPVLNSFARELWRRSNPQIVFNFDALYLFCWLLLQHTTGIGNDGRAFVVVV